MRGGGGEGGVSWKVSGISSWATVGRGPLEVAAIYCWRRESGEEVRERAVWVKRATTQLLHIFLPNVRIFSAGLLTLGGR